MEIYLYILLGIIFFCVIYFAPKIIKGVQDKKKLSPLKPKNEPKKVTQPAESHEHTPASDHTTTKKKSLFWGIVKTLVVIALLIGLAILAVKAGIWVYKEVVEVVKPKTSAPSYRYEDNWVYERTITINFVSKYQDIVRFASDYPLRLSFKSASCSYCVMDYLTKFEACGNAEDDVAIPHTKNAEIRLMFKSRDGQENGKINVIVEKNIKKRVQIK